MPEEDKDNKSEIKSEIAQQKKRDEEGHFIPVEKPKDPKAPQNPVQKFFSENTHYSKGKDDLVDLHIGNPLYKITKLLEDIKKQKAFSFTLKGSLGIAGVALALGVFGVFGGGQILCEKGVQSEIGTVKQLQVIEEYGSTSIPVLSQIMDYFNPKTYRPRIVLIKDDGKAIRLPFSKNVDLGKFAGFRVIVTGDYNSCAQSLTINDPKAVEYFVK